MPDDPTQPFGGEPAVRDPDMGLGSVNGLPTVRSAALEVLRALEPLRVHGRRIPDLDIRLHDAVAELNRVLGRTPKE